MSSFLRSLFGPSRDEIWQQFANAIGGNFTGGGFWNGAKVEAGHGQWTVVLDTFTVSTGKSSITYTRMRAPYVNPDGFQFNIYRQGVFSNLGKWLGMQDVTVGYPQFDEDFIIKGNDETKLRRLFASDKIRELVAAQPDIHFSVRGDEERFWGGRNFPPDVDELYFQVVGVIKDVDRLKLLYNLFSETLDELCRMGSAYEKSPGVKL
ncbi:MAG TPA: DUF3137 domain-containing protein [Verrucomicrobiae bacterium]|nr:DUF3137 domain-containing protein [Verrucomicrobiae bacterium]